MTSIKGDIRGLLNRGVKVTSSAGRVVRFLVAGFLIVGWLAAPSAIGDEPHVAFIEGLRDRGYYDTAIEYVESLRLRSDLTDDVKNVIDLQLGMTLKQKGASSRVPEDREQSLSAAERALQKFVSEQPKHPEAALANSMLGELLLEQARSLIWKSDELESGTKREELQQQARALIDKADGIYKTATDLYQAKWRSYPKFIDKDRDIDAWTERQSAEAKYLRAWYNMARCMYERGQTYEKGTPARKDVLDKAAQLFEKIHADFRPTPIGQQSRLMMGKCFQEQDDLGKALGLYNEVAEQKSVITQGIKAMAVHFRLICLNSPPRNDHTLVVTEASVWIQENKQLASTETGLGILWERAIAQEKLSENRELAEKDKELLLRGAINDASTVAKTVGPFRETAGAMSRRLKLLLGDKDKEPRDFATAFERARGMVAQIQQLNDDLARAANNAERATKKTQLDNHLKEVGRLLKIGLDLRDGESDPKAVAQARYLQSFVMLRQGKALDSVIMASYCLENDRKTDPDTAANATEIAMAAAVAAWNQAEPKNRDFETRLLRDVCIKILELYPQSARGGEARMRLGSVYRTLNEPLEAAKWYLQVPETDPQYASGRISAGQAYWAAWTQKTAMAAADPNGPQTPPQDMQTWKTEARNLLNQGIQIARQKIGEAAKPTDEIVAAEVSLGTIMNLDGEFPATIQRLTAGAENSVATAIEIADGETRPEEGIKSKLFAGLTYRLLLRAYVGTQQIDQALQTMTKLERVGGDDILAAYTQLGIELQEELKRLKSSGENERLGQVRNSFEQFLQKVYESRNKSDYNSLLWIGETYYGLGQGVAGDPAAAEGYYSKAADAYAEIIAGGLATAQNKNAVQLRLARCRRQQKRFDEALKISEEILAQNAMAIDAQFEAAHTLSDWGLNGDVTKLPLSIQGLKDASGKQNVWGWAQLSRRLEQLAAKDLSPDVKARFLDARFELGNSRRRYASVSEKDADSQRKSALAEIASFAQRYRDLDELTFAKFDRLYQDLQADLGQAAKPLERSAAPEPVKEETIAVAEPAKTNVTTPTVTPAVEEPDNGNLLLAVIGTSLAVGLAAGAVVMLRKPKKKVRIPGVSAAPKFSGLSVGASDDNGLPSGLNFEAPAAPDFSGISASTIRKTTAPGQTAKPATRPAAAASPSATSATASPASTATPGRPADAKPRPAVTRDPATGEPIKRPIPAGSSTAKPAAPADATPGVAPKPRPRPAATDGSPAATNPPATPRPPASDGGTPAAKPTAPRPATPKPAAPSAPEAAAAPAQRPASPRPAAEKPPGEKRTGERPIAPPAGPPSAGTPPASPSGEPKPVPRRPKPPEAED